MATASAQLASPTPPRRTAAGRLASGSSWRWHAAGSSGPSTRPSWNGPTSRRSTSVRGQAGQRDRARADLIDPAQVDLTDLVAGQNALEWAGPSDQEIGPSGPTLAGPNVPPCVPNAQQNVPLSVRNARPGVRPISGVGTQARNNDGIQDHNNGLARSRRTGRPSDNKAARDLSNAHAHSNRHGRASITHVRGKVAVEDRVSARSGHDLSRVQRRNESCLVGE